MIFSVTRISGSDMSQSQKHNLLQVSLLHMNLWLTDWKLHLLQKLKNEVLIPRRKLVQVTFSDRQDKSQSMPLETSWCLTFVCSAHLLYAARHWSWVAVIENIPELFFVWIQWSYLPNPTIGMNFSKNSWEKIFRHSVKVISIWEMGYGI